MSLTELSEFGRKGFDYASKIANWDKVIDRYEEALESAPTKRRLNRISRIAKQEIHQVLPNMGCGDAISNQAVFIRNTLRDEGYSSNIYVRNVDPCVSHECAIFSPAAIPESSSIIYHHSVGTELTRHVIAHPGPKFLIYHNITPAEFFEPYRPDFARILRLGRDELRELAQHFLISAGDSAFNAGELRESGFSGPTVLPIPIGPARWNAPPDPALMEQLQDGRTNILFVGRLAPNKKQNELIEAFDIYLMADPSARLILAGPIEENDPYTWHVQDLIKSRGLTASVTLAGCVDDARLAAYYRSAHLFWSMSEHEGFGAPLIEAMWFDVPALAFRSTAVPETLGEAGLMFTDKTDLTAVAALAVLLIEDVDLRHRIIKAQLRQRLRFLPEAVRPLVIDAIRRLASATVSA
jgi:glycosyltransferase involved in cell wall biosynthesis